MCGQCKQKLGAESTCSGRVTPLVTTGVGVTTTEFEMIMNRSENR